MLFDCFLYFDEKELLELRVNMLKDIVDGFIITDADRTFKGDKKDFTCVDTIRKLGLPEEKIQVLHGELTFHSIWITHPREVPARIAVTNNDVVGVSPNL